MHNQTLYYASTLIEAKIEEHLWSTTPGTARFQHAITLRLHTSSLQVVYGDTAADHKLVWNMPPGVEHNKALLSTWPEEEAKHPWERPTALDKWHKLWYELDATGHLLLLHHYYNVLQTRLVAVGHTCLFV